MWCFGVLENGFEADAKFSYGVGLLRFAGVSYGGNRVDVSDLRLIWCGDIEAHRAVVNEV